MSSKFDYLSPGIQITEVDESALAVVPEADGPIIIGRTKKGPALTPVKIRNLSDYVSVFGKPLPGGDSATGDIWRDGAGSAAPTYASYAAQAWLASGNSPITVVRLLGVQHGTADARAEYAGWDLGTNTSGSKAEDQNQTAYGLFMINSASMGQFSSMKFEAKVDTTSSYEQGLIQLTSSTGIEITFEFNADTLPYVGLTYDATEIDTSGLLTKGAILTAIKTAVDSKVSDSTLPGLSTFIEGNFITVRNHGTATWQVTSSLNAALDIIANSNAGLGGSLDGHDFGAATVSSGQGALAAILYAEEGSLQLMGPTGSAAEGSISELSDAKGAAIFVRSTADGYGFKLVSKDSGGDTIDQKAFSFDRNKADYIRNVLNTNPAQTNDSLYDSPKPYWLGESFERHLSSYVPTSTKGEVWGTLLPLHRADKSSDGTYNWGSRRQSMVAGKSGWVIANDTGLPVGYNPVTATKLFRIILLHEGEALQKDLLITFEEMALPTNPVADPYSTFTMRVMDIGGNTLEKFSSLTLNVNSPNYILRKIGDIALEWDEDGKRYRKEAGEFINQSSYIRIEMAPDGLPQDKSVLPFGFLGPARPQGFSIVSGSSTVLSASGGSLLNGGASFTKAYVMGSGSVPRTQPNLLAAEAVGFAHCEVADYSASFVWPSMPMRISGSDGFTSNPFKAYFGVRPKLTKDSSIPDSDYCDYLRGLPVGNGAEGAELWDISDDGAAYLEYSVKFSLDDIRISNSKVWWEEGSRAAEASYTAENGVRTLLEKGVKNWILPVFGGFDGLDVKELEPYRAGLLNETNQDEEDAIVNTLNRALDSVADEEVCPANLMLMPGIWNKRYTSKMIRVCENRQDCLAIIDLEGDYRPSYDYPGGTDAQRKPEVSSAVDALRKRNLNSSYACAFFPWVQVVDTLNTSEIVWLPASVAALGAMAQSEASSELWFAPAGFNRGGLGNLGGRQGPRVTQARMRLDSGERDALYVQNINPIATFPNEGVVIFGQKTLQTTRSALDRINVRRLMLYLKRRISAVAKTVLFDQNVEATWNRFKNDATPILSEVQARYGLTDYKLVLDETTTTAELIDQNILYAQVYLKPARAIEYIAIDFIISSTGAEFA